jgi:hypothetical protein
MYVADGKAGGGNWVGIDRGDRERCLRRDLPPYLEEKDVVVHYERYTLMNI